MPKPIIQIKRNKLADGTYKFYAMCVSCSPSMSAKPYTDRTMAEQWRIDHRAQVHPDGCATTITPHERIMTVSEPRVAVRPIQAKTTSDRRRKSGS